MARRSLYGLVIFVVAGCAVAEKASQETGRLSDGGNGFGRGGDLGGAGSGGAGGGGSGGMGGGSGSDAALGVPSDLAMITCTAGAACTTANPGTCAMGHVACSGNLATCMPDTTTQSCYDGPANTAGVGACKAGTQSCIGSLGTCSGEVTPAAVENCFNDLDDDCDGTVNNGCPSTLSLGTPHALTVEGGSGGGPSQLRCPANSIVTRTVMSWDDNDAWIAGVTIYCSTMTLVRGTSSYSVTLTQSGTAAGSAIGTNATSTQDIPCATTAFNAGQWIDGLATANAGSGHYVAGFGMACETGSLTLGSDNKLAIAFSHANDGTYYYYTGRTDPFFETDCGSNEALVGYNVKTGAWMDSIQAVCAPIAVNYK